MEKYVKTVIVLTVVSHHFGDMLIVWSNDRCMPPPPPIRLRERCAALKIVVIFWSCGLNALAEMSLVAIVERPPPCKGECRLLYFRI